MKDLPEAQEFQLERLLSIVSSLVAVTSVTNAGTEAANNMGSVDLFFQVRVCFVLFCFVLFCFVLLCFVLFCFVLFCFVLFCFVLFCVVLLCLVWFGLVWFGLVWFVLVRLGLFRPVLAQFGLFMSALFGVAGIDPRCGRHWSRNLERPT